MLRRLAVLFAVLCGVPSTTELQTPRGVCDCVCERADRQADLKDSLTLKDSVSSGDPRIAQPKGEVCACVSSVGEVGPEAALFMSSYSS